MKNKTRIIYKPSRLLTILKVLFLIVFVFPLPVFAQSSGSFTLQGYEFGGGGGTNLTSSSYGLQGIVGRGGDSLTSSTFKLNDGLIFAEQANVPPAPTFVNSTNWYNKLKIIINKWAGDASDTKYAIAISTDNFVSDTRYVQNDLTVGSVLGIEDFQTYSAWGGSSGSFIIGLLKNTTYTVKVKAMQGNFTETGWGPVNTPPVSTADLLLSFDIDIGGASDPGSTSPPYTIDLSNLTAGSPTTATNRIWVSLNTNAEAGGYIFVYDQYAGLKSSNLNYTIPSVSNNLAAGGVLEGFGLQGASKTDSSGGNFTYTAPYDGTTENVGLVNSTIQELFNTGSLPVISGRGSVYVKAKINALTPASNDYTDTITMIASSSF